MSLTIILALATIGFFLLRRRVRWRGVAWLTWISIACAGFFGYWLMGFISQFGEPSALAIMPMWFWKLFMMAAGVFILVPTILGALTSVLPPPSEQPRDNPERRR